MKSALNELKGVKAVMGAEVAGLNFPLISVIRYSGHTLVAQSVVRWSFLHGSFRGNDKTHFSGAH